MHWIDLVIIAVVVLSTLVSFMRGFIREILSLLVWLAAIFVGLKFYPEAVPLIQEQTDMFDKDPAILKYLAGVIVGLIALVILGILSYLVSNVLIRKPLGLGDRLLAIVPGAARGVLLVGILGLIVMFSGRHQRPIDYPIDDSYWSEESQLWPQTKELAEWLESIGKEFINDLQKEGPSEALESEVQMPSASE